MKEIKLTQGKVVMVDDWNYDSLSQFKYHAHKKRGTYYAIRQELFGDFAYLNFK